MLKIYKILFLIVIIFSLDLILAEVKIGDLEGFQGKGSIEADIGPPLVLKNPDLKDSISVNNNAPDLFHIQGVSLTLEKDYTGTIIVNKKQGSSSTITTTIERSYPSPDGNEMYYQNEYTDHVFNSGVIQVENGKITSIENAEVKSFSINRNPHSNEPLIISGTIKRYESDKKDKYSLTSKDLNIKSSKHSLTRTIKIKSDKEVSIDIDISRPYPDKSAFDTTITIDSDGKYIDFEVINFDDSKSSGKTNGKISLNSKHYSKEDDNPIFIEPSKENSYAIFKLSDGMIAKVYEKTYMQFPGGYLQAYKPLNDITGILFQKERIYMYLKNNNKIELYLDEKIVDNFYLERIKDNSQAILIQGNKKNTIRFSKGLPIATGDITDSKTLLRNHFFQDGKVYSWELKYGNPKPEIEKAKNILFVVSEDYKSNFPNEYETRKFLSEPLKQFNKNVEKEIAFLKNKRLEEHGNIVMSEFNNLESFINALRVSPPKGEKFDKVVLYSHGSYWGLGILGDLDEATNSRTWTNIEVEDLLKIPDETLEKIRGGLSSNAYCTAISCSIMFLTQPHDLGFDTSDRPGMGPTLSKILDTPVIGSISKVNTHSGITSDKWVVVNPKGEISETPPDFNIPLVLVKNFISLFISQTPSQLIKHPQAFQLKSFVHTQEFQLNHNPNHIQLIKY